MTPPPGFSTPPQIPNINTSERPPVTTTVFAATTPENTPFAYRASISANPNPMISPDFVKANYEDYDEEREMEPRPGPTRETTPPLRLRSPGVRRQRERVVEFEEAPNREGSRAGRNAKGSRPSKIKTRENGNREINIPPLLATYLGRNESGVIFVTVSTVVCSGTAGESSLLNSCVVTNIGVKLQFGVVKSINIIILGELVDIYTLINHYQTTKEIWDQVKELMEDTEMTLQERESKLYDEFDRFKSEHGESVHSYYLRYSKLINDINIIKMSMSNMQINTKFVNHLQPKWSRFVTAAKQARNLHSIKFDQLGEGHMAKQCIPKKRVKDVEWFKEKMLLAQAQESWVVLHED
ncbi:hypothetical protein Tco_1266414 [Tanacetum coccineum]